MHRISAQREPELKLLCETCYYADSMARLTHTRFSLMLNVSVEEMIRQCTEKYPKFDVKTYRKPHIVLASFMGTDLMSKEPNDNTPYEKALAIQISSLVHYMRAVIPLQESDNYMAKAVALRALIENSANIVYMILNKDDQDLALKFLATTDSTAKMLYAIKRGEPITTTYWTSTKIAQRIKIFDDEVPANGAIISFYSFLSSFVHADAGYLSAYTHGFRHSIDQMFELLAELSLEGVFVAAVSDGALREGDADKIVESRMQLASGKKFKG